MKEKRTIIFYRKRRGYPVITACVLSWIMLFFVWRSVTPAWLACTGYLFSIAVAVVTVFTAGHFLQKVLPGVRIMPARQTFFGLGLPEGTDLAENGEKLTIAKGESWKQ